MGRRALRDLFIEGLEQYQRFNAAKHQNADDPRGLEDVSLTFGEIEIESKVAKIGVSDVWPSTA